MRYEENAVKVYILLHHEIFQHGKSYLADPMVFYVLSSLRKALEAIKKSSVESYSWWEIQEQVLDDPDGNWPEHVGYYGRRGGKLSRPPYKKAVAMYKKCKADRKHHLNV
jgi:hypothetical protein